MILFETHYFFLLFGFDLEPSPAMPPPTTTTSRVSGSSKSAAFFIVEEESRTECTGDVFVVATALCRRNKRRDADRAASLQLLLRRRRGILGVSRLRPCWFAAGQLGVFRNGFQIWFGE